MVAAQKVVPLEQIATAALCPNIHMDDKTDKDEPEEKVGRQDVPLVVIVQAPCWGCLPKKGGKRGHHEGGPAWGQVLLTSKNFQALTSNNGAEVEVMLLIGVCGQFLGFPCQPHVEDDQGHDCEDRMLLECKVEMFARLPNLPNLPSSRWRRWQVQGTWMPDGQGSRVSALSGAWSLTTRRHRRRDRWWRPWPGWAGWSTSQPPGSRLERAQHGLNLL